jgi:hypothetical protein
MNALLPELEHRADHLFLLGLDDSLLSPALDENHQLLRGQAVVLRVRHAENPRHRARRRGQEPYERREDPPDPLDRASEQQRDALGVRQRERLRDELTEDDRDDADHERDDEQCDQVCLLPDDRNARQRLLQGSDDAGAREGRRQEADERDPELDHGQEA